MRLSGDEPDRAAQADRVLALGVALRGAEPAVPPGVRLAEMADDPSGRTGRVPPIAEALSGEQVPAAEGTERHGFILGAGPDVATRVRL
jgi:hypothetical protein